MATYTSGVPLKWREPETGNLPSPRSYLRAATVNNFIYATGGVDDHEYLSSILYWNAATEMWVHAGDLSVARSQHGAVAISSSIISLECPIV